MHVPLVGIRDQLDLRVLLNFPYFQISCPCIVVISIPHTTFPTQYYMLSNGGRLVWRMPPCTANCILYNHSKISIFFVDASTSWGIGILVTKFHHMMKLRNNWKVPG